MPGMARSKFKPVGPGLLTTSVELLLDENVRVRGLCGPELPPPPFGVLALAPILSVSARDAFGTACPFDSPSVSLCLCVIAGAKPTSCAINRIVGQSFKHSAQLDQLNGFFINTHHIENTIDCLRNRHRQNNGHK